DLVERYLRDPRQALQLAVPVRVDLRQVGRPDLDPGRGGVRYERRPVAVEDRPAWGLQTDGPQLVVLSGLQVMRALKDLERPEPEEERGEHGERDHAEDPDPQGEPRGQPVRLDDVRARRQEAPAGRRPSRGRTSQAAGPPVDGRPSRAGAAAGARGRRRAL